MPVTMWLPTGSLRALFVPNTESPLLSPRQLVYPFPHRQLILPSPPGASAATPPTATMASPNTQGSVLRVFPHHLPTAKLCGSSDGNIVLIPPKATREQGFKCKKFILLCREYCERGGGRRQSRKAVKQGRIQGQLRGM